MQLSELRIAFPLAFLESLVHETSGSKQNTRHFSASVSKSRRHKHDDNRSHCDIDANFTDLVVQLRLKSETFSCDNKSISCNIIDWNEIVDVEAKGGKCKSRSKQISKCSKARKQKAQKTEKVKVCEGNEPECNRSISFYIEQNISPKRKLLDTDRENGKKLKLSDDVTVLQTDLANSLKTSDNVFQLNNIHHDKNCKSDCNTDGHQDVNKHDFDKLQNGSRLHFEVDCASHSTSENISLSGEKTRKTLSTGIQQESENVDVRENKTTDNTYLQISEVMQHIDVSDLRTSTNADSCPEHLKPVSLGNIDLKVSFNRCVNDNEIVHTEKESSASSLDSLNTEIKGLKSKITNVENATSEPQSKVMALLNLKRTPQQSCQPVKDIKSTLLVEEGTTPVFYIHGKKADVIGCVLLGPFVLQSSPVPHLRLSVEDEIGQLVPSEWTWRKGSRCQEINKDQQATPSRRQPRRQSKLVKKSPKSRKIETNKQLRLSEVEDGDPGVMYAEGEKQMPRGAPQTEFQPCTPGEENGDTDLPVDAASSDSEQSDPQDQPQQDEACPDKLVTLKPTHRKSRGKTEEYSDCVELNMGKERYWAEQDGSGSGQNDACSGQDEAGAVNEMADFEISPEVTKREISPNSATKHKPRQKKKKKKLSKRGMEAMYKRLESYCIKIVPEADSDLWGPVSDPAQIQTSCKFCAKSFPDPLLLADHTRNIHKNQPQYMDFVRENRCKMKLKCNLCVEDRFYGRWESFGQHMRDIHTEKLIGESVQKIKCTLCDKTWVNQNKYDRHLKAAHGSERYLCHLCPATFKWESSLQCHIKGIHEKEMDHSCEICGATFSRKSYVKNHIRKTHSDKGHGGVRRSRGIHCTLCDLRLDKKKDITKHLIEVHQMDRMCKTCKVKFDTDEEMDKHTRDFHGNALCQHCPYCGSGFQARDNMLRHIAKDHLKIMQPKCPLCEKQFDYNTDLRFHLKKEHSYGDQDHTYGQAESLKSIAILKCEYCDKPFFWVMGMINHILASHMDKFPHECKECPQRFLEASSLQHHMAFRHMTVTPSRGHGSGRREDSGGKKHDGKEKVTKIPRQDLHQDLLQKNRTLKEGRPSNLLTGKDMPVKPKDGTVKVISENVFPAEDGTVPVSVPTSVPVSVPDIHGGFMSAQIDRRSAAYSSAERWNYPANQWVAPLQQPHMATLSGHDFLNSDVVVRPDETLYHVMSYVGDNQDVRADQSGLRTQLPGIREDHAIPVTSDHVTSIRSDHVSVRAIEQIPLSTTEHVNVQNTEHVPVRGTEHVPVRTSQYVRIRPKVPSNIYQEQSNRRPARLPATQRIVMAANERARMQAAVDRGIVQGTSDRVLLQGVTDQRLAHGPADRIVVPGTGDRGIVHGAAVHAGVHGSGGDGQVITADNLIGLLSEFNSQQQSNPYFQTQFF
ncbi:uncharacterized protein [Haliotis asinina]|uniref:uncharacterized protein n=1 Tax=Haliotis asinina TaxID=109174 RepID=UPI0035327AAA